MSEINLTHHFLIAMPGLVDPNFHQTLAYICEHNENGAMGLVVNRPMELALGDILEQMDIEGAGIGVTTSRDILQALAEGAAPRRLLVTLGYAGWAGGQLEHEISQNAWLTTPADLGILFDLPPEQKLDAAAAQLGIDMRMLSSDAGHA